MINPRIRKTLAIFLLLSCITAPLSSCSHAVEYDGDQAVYNGEKYVLYSNMSPGETWYPLPSSDQTKKVDRTVFWPIRVTSFDPILATTEDSPNFLIICADGTLEVSKHSSVVFIRSDIELSSVFETAFGSVTVTYDDDVKENEKFFDHFPQGTTFDDIVGSEPYIMHSPPNEWDYYCKLTCTHPEIDYLVCDFSVIRADDNFYLSVELESFKQEYYLLSFEK